MKVSSQLLMNRITSFNKRMPIKVELKNLGGDSDYLVLKDTQYKILDQYKATKENMYDFLTGLERYYDFTKNNKDYVRLKY